MYIYTMVIAQPWELKYCEVVAYIRYTFWAKMASFREAFLGKRFVCCALTIVYSIYNTVGRSIADIYDPRRHIYRGALRLGKYVASGRIYRLWTSLPYYIYNIHHQKSNETRCTNTDCNHWNDCMLCSKCSYSKTRRPETAVATILLLFFHCYLS